jgi:predicted RNase H-like HicB family nuclease
MSEERYTVRIHDEGSGDYRLWAEIEQLPGLFATGRDHDELLEALTETIGGYLSEPGREVRVENVTEIPSEDGSHTELSVHLVDSEEDDGRPRYDDPVLDNLSRDLWALRFKEGRRALDDEVVLAMINLGVALWTKKREAGEDGREAG